MGNFLSSRRRGGGGSSSRRSHPPLPDNQSPQPEITANRYVFAAATPYPSRYPNHNPPPQYYQYPGYYPHAPPATPLPLHPTYDDGRQPFEHVHGGWGGGRCPYGPVAPPYVEHQKAVTIRNDINIKKEAFRIEQDECNPGQFLVAFTFDATVPGCLTIIFFAKEGEDCNLYPTKADVIKPITVHFQQGLGQKFRQPSGTGIYLSEWGEAELVKGGGGEDVYPLTVKAEAAPGEESSRAPESDPKLMNSQITQAVFEKEKDGYRARVVRQILWVSGMRYELQEIYGIGNSIDADFDGNDPGKECVICLSEPRDTTVLPCRHMCMCNGCAKVLRYQTNRCPICRHPVERLLEIRVNNEDERCEDE